MNSSHNDKRVTTLCFCGSESLRYESNIHRLPRLRHYHLDLVLRTHTYSPVAQATCVRQGCELKLRRTLHTTISHYIRTHQIK